MKKTIINIYEKFAWYSTKNVTKNIINLYRNAHFIIGFYKIEYHPDISILTGSLVFSNK